MPRTNPNSTTLSSNKNSSSNSPSASTTQSSTTTSQPASQKSTEHPSARTTGTFARDFLRSRIKQAIHDYNYENALFLCERLQALDPCPYHKYLLAETYYLRHQPGRTVTILATITNNMNLGKATDPVSMDIRYLYARACVDLEKYVEAERTLLGSKSSSLKEDQIRQLKPHQIPRGAAGFHLLATVVKRTGRQTVAKMFYLEALKADRFSWTSYEALCEMGAKPPVDELYQVNDLIHGAYQPGSQPTPSGPVAKVKGVTLHPTPFAESNKTEPRLMKQSSNPLLKPLTPISVQCEPSQPWCAAAGGAGASSQPAASEGQSTISETSHLTFNSNQQFPTVDSPGLDQSASGQAMGLRDPPSNPGPDWNQYCLAPVAFNLNDSQLPNHSPFNYSNGGQTPPLVNSDFHHVQVRLVDPSAPCPPNGAPGQPSRGPPSSNQVPRPTMEAMDNDPPDSSDGEENARRDRNTRKRQRPRNKAHGSVAMDVDVCKTKRRAITTVGQAKSEEGPSVGEVTGFEELAQCFLLLGKAYYLQCQFKCKEALAVYEKLSYEHKRTGFVIAQMARCWFELTKYDLAVQTYEEMHRVCPWRIKGLDYLSTALWHLKDEVKLSYLSHELKNYDPRCAESWIVIGNCYSCQKEHEQALQAFQKAKSFNKNHPYAYTLAAHEFVSNEDYEKAIQGYRQAIRIDNRHYTAWYGLGSLFQNQENYDLAEYHYRQAIKIHPRNAVIYCCLGMTYCSAEKFNSALEVLQKAEQISPENSLVKYNKATVYDELQAYDDAIEELKKVAEICPKEASVYLMMGKVYTKMKKSSEAMLAFSEALNLNPKDKNHIKAVMNQAIHLSSDYDDLEDDVDLSFALG